MGGRGYLVYKFSRVCLQVLGGVVTSIWACLMVQILSETIKLWKLIRVILFFKGTTVGKVSRGQGDWLGVERLDYQAELLPGQSSGDSDFIHQGEKSGDEQPAEGIVVHNQDGKPRTGDIISFVSEKQVTYCHEGVYGAPSDRDSHFLLHRI